MGGNVEIYGELAHTIEASATLVADLQVMRALIGGLFPSGSTAILFDENYRHLKDSYGDIDLQVDIDTLPKLQNLLVDGMSVGAFTLIGSMRATNTVVSLWRYNDKNIQIDFEGVEFREGEPTEWSRFAYSASPDDVARSIKGVAHKYIFRALTAQWLGDYNIKRAKSTKVVRTSYLAFSNKGLRVKLVPDVYGNHWYELKTQDSKYITNVKDIFHKLISSDTEYTPSVEHRMWSYVGVLELIKGYIDETKWEVIADGMANLLWGPSAQEIYRDLNEDRACKLHIMQVAADALNICMSRWEPDINSYYGSL